MDHFSAANDLRQAIRYQAWKHYVLIDFFITLWHTHTLNHLSPPGILLGD
jgi:hypothetical protein